MKTTLTMTAASVLVLLFLSCCSENKSNIGTVTAAQCREHIDAAFYINNNLERIDRPTLRIKVDSLLDVIGELRCDSVQYAANKIMRFYFEKENKLDSSLISIQKSEDIARKMNDSTLLKSVYSGRASTLSKMKKIEEARNYYERALAIKCQELGERKCNGMNIPIHANYGSFLASLAEIDNAIVHLAKADSLSSDKLSEDIHPASDSSNIMIVNHTLGNLYNHIGERNRALSAYEKAFRYCSVKNKRARTIIKNSVNSTHVILENYDEARQGIEELIQSNPDESHLLYPYQALAEIESNTKNYTQAVKYAKKALQLSKKFNKHEDACKLVLARAYSMSDNFSSSLPLWNEVLSKNNLPVKTKIDASYEQLNDILGIKKMNREATMLDSIQSWQTNYIKDKNANELAQAENKFNERILQDSIHIYKLEANNQKLQVRSQRNGLGFLSLLGLGLLFSVYTFRKRYQIQQEENTILQLSNEELHSYNEQLQVKIENINSQKREEEPIAFQSINKTIYLKPSDIQHIKAEYNGVRIFGKDNNYWSSLSLKKTFEKLEVHSFIQIHRSTLVNLRYIELVNSTYLRLKDGSEHNIGRAYKKKLKDGLREEE